MSERRQLSVIFAVAVHGWTIRGKPTTYTLATLTANTNWRVHIVRVIRNVATKKSRGGLEGLPGGENHTHTNQPSCPNQKPKHFTHHITLTPPHSSETKPPEGRRHTHTATRHRQSRTHPHNTHPPAPTHQKQNFAPTMHPENVSHPTTPVALNREWGQSSNTAS